MSYRCSVCNEKVKPGVAQRRHVVERVRSTVPVMVDGNAALVERMEVAAELPVCERCDWRLRLGASLVELRREFADLTFRAYVPPAPVLQPMPEPPAEPAGFKGRKVLGTWRAKNQSIAVTANNTNHDRKEQ